MRNVMRALLLAFVSVVSVQKLQAHDVVWWENPGGYFALSPLVFYQPFDEYRHFYVDPEMYEPCTVVVVLSNITSTLVNAYVEEPNPANSVTVHVTTRRAPTNHVETAVIGGYWYATGSPLPSYCTATNPNPFTVPITVSDEPPTWDYFITNSCFFLELRYQAALMIATEVNAAYVVAGMGQTFTVAGRMPQAFFKPSKELGGFISGTIWNPSGQALTGVGLDLMYGGAAVTSDTMGNYSFPRMPAGSNELVITNPAVHVSLPITVLDTNNVIMDIIADMEAETNEPPPTNVCNCTPWAAIGYGTIAGGTTAVYFSGGANPPKTGEPNCETAEVTVTPPNGPPFSITPGTRRRQNSGDDPASGDWTVTAVVCGKTKTATVTVP